MGYEVLKKGLAIIIEAAESTGLKVGKISPTHGYVDVVGQIYPDTGGPDAPSLLTWRGANRRFAYGAADRMGTEIHIPHSSIRDDMYLHFHWGHNGTAISGDLVLAISVDHTKGHRAAGGGTYTQTFTIPSASLAQYASDITDFIIANDGGGVGLMDYNDIEVDDSINISMIVTSIPTITGGSGKPFIWNADIHAKSSGVGTKNRLPNFYTE